MEAVVYAKAPTINFKMDNASLLDVLNSTEPTVFNATQLSDLLSPIKDAKFHTAFTLIPMDAVLARMGLWLAVGGAKIEVRRYA